MKKLNFIIKCGLALLLLSFYSCESWLNVTPSDRLSEEMLFNDREGFVKALNGVYIELNTNELYGRNLTAGALDVMGQYYSVASSSHAFYNYGGLVYTGNDEKALFDNMWQKCYAVIACCNTIIEKCDERQDVLPGVYYGLYKGEALALRAMLHLDMLRLFGPVYDETSKTAECIPYVTNTDAQISPLLSAEVVLESVIGDLKTALNLLKESDPVLTDGVRNEGNSIGDNALNYRQFRLNYYAVKALLVRAYAWGHDESNALVTAEEILREVQVEGAEIFPFVTHAAATDVSKPDRVFSSEVMFSLYDSYRGTEIQDKLFLPTLDQIYTFTGKRLELGKDYSFYASENDYRRNIWASYSNAGKLIDYHRKYEDITTSGAELLNKMVPLIRLSEIYLLAAEYTDDFVTAKGYLDRIRNSRNCPSSVATEPTLMEEITKECRREFLGEGQMFFFYKRRAEQQLPNGRFETDNDKQWIDMSMSNYVIPLPDSETDMRLN